MIGKARDRGFKFAAILFAGTIFMALPVHAEELHVEYDNLRQLLIDGNLELQDKTDTYYTNIENYQKLIDTMSEERDYMLFKKEQYEDDAAASGQYQQNASNLLNSIKRLERQLTRAKSSSGFLSTDKTIDSYTMSAQVLMNSYNQMVFQVRVKEKSVAAAEADYRTVQLKFSSGAAAQAEVQTASDRLLEQQNQLASYQRQAADLRFDLLSMLGLTDDGSVVIGTVPEPDLAAIDAIDFEADRTKAVNNDRSVQSARHTYAKTASERSAKADEENFAAGTAEAEITDAYQQLLAKKTAYQAAREQLSGAELSYQSLQRKKQAGMLSNADFLEGEASYLEALSGCETAKMNLYQAYEDYLWEVKGIG